MEEAPISNQESQASGDRRYPERRFILLLIVIALLAALMAVAEHADKLPPQSSTVSQDALQGDLAMKTSLAYSWLSKTVPGTEAGQLRRSRASQLRKAAASYTSAIRSAPVPRHIRRYIIVQAQTGNKFWVGYGIHLLEMSAARREYSRNARSKLYSEARMWAEVYLAPGIPRDQVSGYATRIRGLNLGWYRHMALADLYARAGLVKQAGAERNTAIRSASTSLIILGVLIGLAILLGFAGLVLLIMYLNRRRSQEMPGEFPSGDRILAGYLLEVFVVYLASLIGLQVLAGAPLAAATVAGRTPSNLVMVLTALGSYVIGSLVALAYLAARLRRAGWTWEMLGFRSERPLRDVLWGVGGYAAALPLVLIASVITQSLGRLVKTPDNPIIPLFANSDSVGIRILLFLLATVAAPFFEEVFFRGALFTSFRARWGVNAAIYGTALVFAIIHPLPGGLLPIFALGSVLGTLRYETGSLLPSMVAHALFNSGNLLTLMATSG